MTAHLGLLTLASAHARQRSELVQHLEHNLKVFPWDSISILFSKYYTMEKQKQKYKIRVNDSTLKACLKKFFHGHRQFCLCHGTVFRFYFRNTTPRKNALTLASAGPTLKKFFVAQYFDFMPEQYFVFIIFRSTESHGKTHCVFTPPSCNALQDSMHRPL